MLVYRSRAFLKSSVRTWSLFCLFQRLLLLEVFLLVNLSQTKLALFLVEHQPLLVLVRVFHGLDFSLDIVPGLVLDPLDNDVLQGL